MSIKQILSAYRQLCEDDQNLSQLGIWAKTEKEKKLIRSLQSSNQNYRQELINLVWNNFPATANDVSAWTIEEHDCWFNLLLTYPIFWQGKQETLIGLLWSLDCKGKIQQQDEVASLCTHSNMVDYAADPHNFSVVNVLHVLIDKYVTLMQAEIFQNKVDLAVNDIH